MFIERLKCNDCFVKKKSVMIVLTFGFVGWPKGFIQALSQFTFTLYN